MNQVDDQSVSAEEELFPRGSGLLPLIPALIAFGLRLVLFPSGPRPQLLAGLSVGNPAGWWDPASAVFFALIVFTVSWMARRWAGPWGAIGAGLVLALSWPALLATAMPPLALVWVVAAVVGLAWVMGEGRLAPVGWTLWGVCAVVLVLPALRVMWFGQDTSEGFVRDTAMLQFWRSQISLLRWPLFLGGAGVFALGLTGLFLSRGKPAAVILVGYLFAGVLTLWFAPWGTILFLPVLCGLAVLSGMAFLGLFQALRGKRWKATAILITLLVVLSAWGSWFSRVSSGELARAEMDARLQSVHSLLLHRDLERAASDLNWLHEHGGDDRRVRLLDAEILYAKKRYHEAVLAFKILRRTYPEWKAPLLHSAWANYYDKSYGVAERTFQRILKDEPENVSAIIGLGACRIYRPKDYVEAERLIKKGLSLDQDNIDGNWNMVQLLLVQKNPTAEQVEELRYYLRRTMELDKDNREVMVYVRRSGWFDLIPEDQRSPSDRKRIERDSQTP